MGDSIVVVCRSKKLAARMCEFLNDHGQMLADAVGYDYAPQWWQPGEVRFENKFTSFRGIGRSMDFAAFRWAALKVARTQRSFPFDSGEGRLRFAEPVPYIRYDGYLSWPVIGPPHGAKLKGLKREGRPTDKTLAELTGWMQVDKYGINQHAEDAYLYLKYDDPNYMDRLVQAQRKLGITSDHQDAQLYWEARELAEKLAKPWCEEKLRPLREAMKQLDREWG